MIIADGFVLVKNAPHRQNANNWLKLLGSAKGQDTFNPFKGLYPCAPRCQPQSVWCLSETGYG